MLKCNQENPTMWQRVHKEDSKQVRGSLVPDKNDANDSPTRSSTDPSTDAFVGPTVSH